MKRKLLMKKALAWTLTAAVVMTMNVPVYASRSEVQDTGEIVLESPGDTGDEDAGLNSVEEPAAVIHEQEEAVGDGQAAAESSVAQIGAETYTSLGAAIEAAQNDTITLVADTDVSNSGITIPAGKKITLDLNGHAVKAANTQSGQILVLGVLVLEDGVGTGRIYSETDYSNAATGFGIIEVNGSGSFTMNGGCVNAVRDDAFKKGNYGVTVVGNAEFTMNDGIIEAGWYAVSGNGTTSKNTTITINGGELKSTADYAVYHPGSSSADGSGKCSLNIYGGTIQGAAGAVAMRGGVLSVYDGELVSHGSVTLTSWPDGTGLGPMGNAVINLGKPYNSIDVLISGGSFTGVENAPCLEIHERATDAKVSISGGTFTGGNTDKVQENLTEGYALDGEGNVIDNRAAQIGEEKYPTLSAAIAASTAGDTIQLISDTVEAVTIAEDKNITLDLNGHILKNSAEAQDKNMKENERKHTITNNGNLTITDTSSENVSTQGTVDNVSHGRAAILNNAGSVLKIHGGNITRSEEKGQSPTDSGGNSWYVIKNEGIIDEISGGHIFSNGYYSSLICNVGRSVSDTAKINSITGGTFEHNFVILKNDDYSEIGTISGGTFTVGAGAKQTAVLLNYGKIGKITGGEFTNNGEWIVIRCGSWIYDNQTENDIVGTIGNISGGTFRAAEGGTVLLLNDGGQEGKKYTSYPSVSVSGGNFIGKVQVSPESQLALRGGTYSLDVSKEPNVTINSGYETVKLSDGSYAVQPIYVYVPTLVSEINVSPSSVTLEEGNAQVLSASVAPANADNQTLSWASSDSGVASVSGGTVTAVAPGTAVITASATDGSGVSGSCTVTVTKKAEIDDPDVPDKTPVIVEVELEKKEDGTVEIPESITKEQTDAIGAAIEAATENNYVVINLPQSDGAVPSISSDIIEKAIDSKTELLQIKTTSVEGDKDSVEATFTMDVSAGTKVDTTVKAINTGIRATIDESAQKVVDEKIPSDASVMKLELAHNGPFPMPVKITLSVDGKFKAGDAVYLYYINKDTNTVELVGGAPLTVEADGTVSFTLEHASSYIISDKAEIVEASGITLDRTAANVKAGGKITLKASIAPENATDQEVTWTTSNGKIATVDKGIVIGMAAGKATITAQTSNGLTASCTVTVIVSKLSAPTSVKAASAGYNSIKVGWKKVTGAKKYYVYRATSAKGKYKRIGTSATTSYTDKKLVTGKNYYYKVRAGYNKIYSGYSKAAVAYPKPARPVVTAKGGKNSVTLTWKKVSGATGYTVYRATSKNGKYTKVKVITSGKTVKYADKKLKSKKTYYYKVRVNRKVAKKTIQSSSSKIAYGKTK